MSFLKSAFFLVFISTMTACIHKTDLSSIKAVSFSGDIQPILAGNCSMSGCHSDDHGSGSGGHELFPLSTYSEVMDHGEIKSGNARSSKLYRVVTNREGGIMPPSPRPILTEDQMKQIYLWIEQGAKDN